MLTNYDFVSIGDTVTDAFIRLKDAEVHCRLDHEACEICMRFGDKVPYESVTVIPGVGNSANAAVAAARLGLKTAFVSNVGDDEHGREIIATLAAEGIDTRFIMVHRGHRTNYHYVLWFQDDRTILIKHEPYDYELPEIGEPKWVYLSSLGENSLPFHDIIERYLAANPRVKLAFQPGTYQMKFGADALAGIYRRAEAVFCNREEARRILRTHRSPRPAGHKETAPASRNSRAPTPPVNACETPPQAPAISAAPHRRQRTRIRLKRRPASRPPAAHGAGRRRDETRTARCRRRASAARTD